MPASPPQLPLRLLQQVPAMWVLLSQSQPRVPEPQQAMLPEAAKNKLETRRRRKEGRVAGSPNRHDNNYYYIIQAYYYLVVVDSHI